jgi:site-specific DNA recombinase
MAVFRILTNPAYRGFYRYRHSEHEQIFIPVPAIVDEAIWQSAQAQLVENGLYSRRNNQRHPYLLRGLIGCPRCGGNYTGFVQHGYRGYRCNRVHWTASSTGKRCPPGAIPAGPVEEAVWEAVQDALKRPEVLVKEYTRRLKASGSATDLEFEGKQIGLALKRVKAQEDRVTEAYVNEAMDLERYKAEMDRLRARRQELERTGQEIERRARQEDASRKALEQLEAFCCQVAQGLEHMTFEERQQLLRLIVERIIVENGRVKVETVIPTESDGKLRNVHSEPVEP